MRVRMKILKSSLITMAFCLLTLLTTSCQLKANSTTTGNPFVTFYATGSSAATTVAKQMWHGLLSLFLPTASALPAPGTMMDAVGNTVTVTKIWFTIGEIEFKYAELPDGSEVDGSDVSFTGPYTVDMLSSSPTPLDAGNITIDLMRRIKVKLVKTTSVPGGAPAGLSNNSIYMEGTVNGHAFIFTSQDEAVMEIYGPNLVTALENSSLLLQLRTANLIRRIDLSAITSSTTISESNKVNATNPCPNINSSASDLYTCIRGGFETESTLGRDDNGDHEIESNESSFD